MWMRIRCERCLGWYERASEKTSKTACGHADDAHERSSTPDDHETERSSEWTRNLETFSGRAGAGTQRTVLSDTVAAVSVCGRQKSGLGGEWERLVRRCEAQSSGMPQDTIKAAILAQPTRSRMAKARWSERDEAARARSSQK